MKSTRFGYDKDSYIDLLRPEAIHSVLLCFITSVQPRPTKIRYNFQLITIARLSWVAKLGELWDTRCCYKYCLHVRGMRFLKDAISCHDSCLGVNNLLREPSKDHPPVTQQHNFPRCLLICPHLHCQFTSADYSDIPGNNALRRLHGIEFIPCYRNLVS